MATRQVVAELVAKIPRDTGVPPVVVEAAGGVDVAKRVRSGEAVDIVILASNAIDQLIVEGRLAAGSRVDLVASGIAVGARTGHPSPAIDSEEAVKHAVLAARTLCYSTGPSGVYLEKLFERWGILEAIRGRIVVPAPGVPVGALIAGGEADLGFQQWSELLHLPGVDVIGPLPPAIQHMTIFSGGIGAACGDPRTARALLDYMASPATAGVKRRHGMDAVPPGDRDQSAKFG